MTRLILNEFWHHTRDCEARATLQARAGAAGGRRGALMRQLLCRARGNRSQLVWTTQNVVTRLVRFELELNGGRKINEETVCETDSSAAQPFTSALQIVLPLSSVHHSISMQRKTSSTKISSAFQMPTFFFFFLAKIWFVVHVFNRSHLVTKLIIGMFQ